MNKLFMSNRWNEYQDVKVLNIKVPTTQEDKKKAKEFRKYIDKITQKEKSTKK